MPPVGLVISLITQQKKHQASQFFGAAEYMQRSYYIKIIFFLAGRGETAKRRHSIKNAKKKQAGIGTGGTT
jgi:hypothetical protein